MYLLKIHIYNEGSLSQEEKTVHRHCDWEPFFINVYVGASS